MLPFSLRAVWFSLSISGLASCWIFLICFCRNVGTFWPLMYCVGCTLVQGIFCLGMIYKMNPFLMPYSFCVAQSFLMGLGVFFMTGTAATFSMATTYASYKPKIWKTGRQGIMAWRPVFIWSLIVFPLLASALQIVMTFRFDHRGRSDDLHCDYSDPTWLRFLSYAGTPWLLSLPCLFFSITSIRRIHKTNKHIERSRDPGTQIPDGFTPQAQRSKTGPKTLMDSTRPTSSRQSSGSLDANRESNEFSIQTVLGRLSSSSEASRLSAFPTFAKRDRGTAPVDGDGSDSKVDPSKDDWDIPQGIHPSGLDDIDKVDRHSWNDDDDDPKFGYGKGDIELVMSYGNSESSNQAPASRRYGMGRRPRQPIPTLSPDIYRVIFCQIIFSAGLSLASLSTVIDIARHHSPPSPFGTQHVALILSAWGPALIFANREDMQRCAARIRQSWR